MHGRIRRGAVSAEPDEVVMLSNRKLAAIVTVAAAAMSGITFAQIMPDRHSMGPD
jgi:hypothetical protein